MPSEKEIEEAIDWIKNEEFGAIGNSHTYTLIDAYLSMKAERDDYRYLFKHEQIASSRAEAERDKYKAIVEADTIALECFNDWWHRPNNDRTIGNIEGSMVLCKNALALREKES